MPLCITGILAARGRACLPLPGHGFKGPTRRPPTGGFGPTRTGLPTGMPMSTYDSVVDYVNVR
jgi:hypothetical protein